MLSAGLDLSTELSIFTWSGYYNNPKSAKELQKVEILEDELNHLKKLLLSDRISDDADVMITNSHVFIYELIHNCMERNDHYKDIRCINIDLHHDFVNGSEDVDCEIDFPFIQRLWRSFQIRLGCQSDIQRNVWS